MHDFHIYPPIVSGQNVRFRWSVNPVSSLYLRNEFYLTFPESIDTSQVPYDLWWLVSIMCLHPHWPLLRPCRVHIPIKLHTADKEVLLRLMDARVAMLEAHGNRSDYQRSIEINDFGLPLYIPTLSANEPRCAGAFSGGKDSLLQAGLLAELTERPVLVTTTSPLPGKADHTTGRRAYVLEEIKRRRNVDLVEVKSNFRSSFDNGYPHKNRGYPVAVNELNDTLLYSASVLAVAAAVRANHLFLASETEVQENALVNGRIIEHKHSMYSTVTILAWDSLLRRYGFHYSSLQSPLHSQQVQELLWTRYSDLCDLQYSCWRVPENKAACSRCSQCLRVGFNALAMNSSPGRMGVDMVSLMLHYDGGNENLLVAPKNSDLPTDRVKWDLWADTVQVIQHTRWRRLIGEIVHPLRQRLRKPETWRAVVNALKFKWRVDRLRVRKLRGFRSLFLPHINDLLRDEVAEIYAQHFDPENEAEYRAVVDRSDQLAAWITAPIRAADTVPSINKERPK